MKLLSILGLMVFLTSCGYVSKDNEVVGQPKRIHKNTPIICPDFSDVDLSLGVLRNGVGSMSTDDIYLNIADKEQEKILNQAVNEGKLVKIHYDEFRFVVCRHAFNITSVELLTK
jgi:hypothetical protein